MEKETEVKSKSAGGLTPNVAATLAYLVGFISGIFFLLTSKDSYVRFHAMQSTIVSIGLAVINIVLGYIPVLGALISPLVGLLGLILWIVCMLKAYKGEKYKLPYVGDLAEQQLSGKK